MNNNYANYIYTYFFIYKWFAIEIADGSVTKWRNYKPFYIGEVRNDRWTINKYASRKLWLNKKRKKKL